MKICAISFFDPASVVLSHRNLMRSAGHDFRLAVVRAYTERQRDADYVLERLVEDFPIPGQRRLSWEKLSTDLEELREFAASADVIQFHPGIGDGQVGNWASRGDFPQTLSEEFGAVLGAFGLSTKPADYAKRAVMFVHGSNSVQKYLKHYRAIFSKPMRVATSTIDYAHELDAAYLPPFVDVGDLRAPPRGDDDPLLIAHTPTDRVACSTAEFLKVAQSLGIPVRLGENLRHKQVLQLKSECNAGFDHLRGAFSVNTLENAALGLASLFGTSPRYGERAMQEGFPLINAAIGDADDLKIVLRRLANEPATTRDRQRLARSWWETYFSAAPITKRLVKFYESL